MIVTLLIRRKHLVLGAITFVLIGGLVAWRTLHVSDLVTIGVGYTAQQTCACLFVGGRTLESCRGDLDPLARRLVSVEVTPEDVTARSLVVVSATSHYEKGFGCALRD